MKALSDLITNKEQEYNIQRAKSQPMTEDDLGWIKAKQFLDSLTGNYESIFTEALSKNTFHIRKKQNKKGTIIELEKYFGERSLASGMKVGKYRVLLEICEDENKIVNKVNYMIFSQFPTICYIRNII